MEERVTVLLSVWENWSIFSSNYLTGLEAFFFLTETESVIVKEQINKLNNTLTSDMTKEKEKDKLNEKEKDKSKEDLESLKRKAKSAGISINDASTIAEITAKLVYVEKYSRLKLLRNKEDDEFTITISSASTEIDRASKSLSTVSGMRVPRSSGQGDRPNNEDRHNLKLNTGRLLGEDDDEDIDGVPLNVISSHNNQYNQENNNNENGDYDSDIDGVAIDEYDDRNISQILKQNQNQNQNQNQIIYSNEYDDDDVDGVPFSTEVENLSRPIVSNDNNSNNNNNDNINYGKRNRENELVDSTESNSNKNDKKKNDKNSNKKGRVSSDKKKYDSDSDSDGDGDGPGRIDFL